uniref:AlNc14C83G5365 protein n=1 Tax=Albugo laibachii Nc14 TaxID=890382 RepID=F0WFI0_9STRA|nr:AlNc14C83G5365 [Albugo laibachii Nc14]|eukprot:CCA19962.1 AlNc14C83G5365 [Albugo laibachii Nc14]
MLDKSAIRWTNLPSESIISKGLRLRLRPRTVPVKVCLTLHTSQALQFIDCLE